MIEINNKGRFMRGREREREREKERNPGHTDL
jgi:hypothetical protein